MDWITRNEINIIANLMRSEEKKRKCSTPREYIVFLNASPVSWYFACALMRLTQICKLTSVSVVVLEPDVAGFIREYQSENEMGERIPEQEKESVFARVKIIEGVKDFLAETLVHTDRDIRVCTFLDASNERYASIDKREQYLNELNDIAEYVRSHPNAKLVHSTVLPQIQSLPNGMTAVSEREYEVYCSSFASDSAERLVLQSEEILRSKAKNGLQVVATRMQNLFGPGITNPLIDGIRNGIVESKHICADIGTCYRFIDLNHIRFAAMKVHCMFLRGKQGNIYNLQQYRTTPFQVATQVYPYFASQNVKLNCEGEACTPEYRLLCSKKANALHSSKYGKEGLIDFIYLSLISGTSLEYDDYKKIFAYDGKLDAIKMLELDILSEIKRICEKYEIKYFLVGGSLLGAVRHKGFIPWDDDLDIGMLREDYNKFREVAPKELDKKYYYQSCWAEDNSHYIFDKIRLRDTFFSTKFSNQFAIENGVFVDILVYDKTAKSLRNQKLHIKLLCVWARAINVRWVNKPRKNVAYKLSKVLLPVMRLVPFKLYHKVFDALLTRYATSNNEWLIDGVGQNIRKGAFPETWFDEIIEVPFENTTAPIPKCFDEYLRHWYGDNYMLLPPPPKRGSGHTLNRIDLGAYIKGFGFEDATYYCASRNGELFDEVNAV